MQRKETEEYRLSLQLKHYCSDLQENLNQYSDQIDTCCDLYFCNSYSQQPRHQQH